MAKNWLKMSIVKDRNKDNPNAGEIKNEVFVGVDWFKSSKFINMDNRKMRKVFVKRKLRSTQRSEISDNFEIAEEERVVVTRQESHSLDEALFDEHVEIPDNLIDNDKKTGKGGKPEW
jgi:CO dehydrogenase/acetyl-CoA synthase beta subunit